VGLLDDSTSPLKERYAVSNDNVFKLIQPGAFSDCGKIALAIKEKALGPDHPHVASPASKKPAHDQIRRSGKPGDEAIAACSRLLALNPKNAVAYSNRGWSVRPTQELPRRGAP
jgi:hypothetical protein